MKKIVSLILVLSISIFAFSQWTPTIPGGPDIINTNTGKVAIGSTNNINEKLTINGNIQLWDFDNTYSNRLVRVLDRLILQCTNNPSNDWNRAMVASNIAWDNVTQKWEVGGGLYSDFGAIRFENSGRIGFYCRNVTGTSYSMTESEMQSHLKMIINETGNVGIGVRNPGSFKLAVEGMIGAREIKVTTQSPFPDYVFNKNYQLRDLRSLEKYINQYKHLPGMPSAEEVEKNNGVELGDMTGKLLEKVEELTLYIIELNKKIDGLQKENKSLRKR